MEGNTYSDSPERQNYTRVHTLTYGRVHTLTYKEVRYQDLAHVVTEAEKSRDQQLASWRPGLAKGLVPV